MNENDVYAVCDAFGLRCGQVHGGSRGQNISIACFPSGTPVLTDVGYRSIESIRVGQRVLTEVTGYQPVVGLHRRYFTGNLVTLDVSGLSHFPLTGTENHRVPCIRQEAALRARQQSGYRIRNGLPAYETERSLVRLDEIRVGDYVRVPLPPSANVDTVEIDVAKYQTEFAMSKVGSGEVTVRIKSTTIPLDADLGALLGMWIAEGSVGGASGTADVDTAVFTFSRGEPFVAECTAVINRVFGLSPHLYEYDRRATRSDVHLSNWLVARWLQDIIGCDAPNKRIPDFIMTSPPSVAEAFINAYWRSGGGHTDARKSQFKTIYTVSKTIANQLPILLGRVGLASRVVVRKARVDKDDVSHLESYAISWSATQRYCSGKPFNGGMWFPVKRISKTAVVDLPVFNLAVDVDETYTVGPFAVKNCPLAIKNHSDPNDWNLSCSVSISDTEPSLAYCFSYNCSFKGSFFRMLVEAAAARGNPPALKKILDHFAPTEKFTHEGAVYRFDKVFMAIHDAKHRDTAIVPAADKETIPEARMSRFTKRMHRYALDRGLTMETCKYWGMGYDSDKKRVVFPIRRRDGKLVGLTGRDVTGKAENKYHNYAGLDKSKYLFGEWLLKIGQPIIVVEGQFDAVLTWQHLQIPTVAPLGNGFSEAHVKTIAAFNPPFVYIFPDHDSAGFEFAEKVAYMMFGRAGLKIMLPPKGMDPGELTKAEAEHAFANAYPINLKKISWAEVIRRCG